MRRIRFEENALKQFHEWERTDERIFRRIIELLDDARQNPFNRNYAVEFKNSL